MDVPITFIYHADRNNEFDQWRLAANPDGTVDHPWRAVTMSTVRSRIVTSGTKLTMASLVGAAIVATVSILRTPRSAPNPRATQAGADVTAAEDAIQRTFEGRTY